MPRQTMTMKDAMSSLFAAKLDRASATPASTAAPATPLSIPTVSASPASVRPVELEAAQIDEMSTEFDAAMGHDRISERKVCQMPEGVGGEVDPKCGSYHM